MSMNLPLEKAIAEGFRAFQLSSTNSDLAKKYGRCMQAVFMQWEKSLLTNPMLEHEL